MESSASLIRVKDGVELHRQSHLVGYGYRHILKLKSQPISPIGKFIVSLPSVVLGIYDGNSQSFADKPSQNSCPREVCVQDVKLLGLDKFLYFFDLKKQPQISGWYQVNLDSSSLQLIDNILFLLVKIETMELKFFSVVDQGCFGNELFSTSATQAFDQMQDFDSGIGQVDWVIVERNWGFFIKISYLTR
jgi:hypothetical protein